MVVQRRWWFHGWAGVCAAEERFDAEGLVVYAKQVVTRLGCSSLTSVMFECVLCILIVMHGPSVMKPIGSRVHELPGYGNAGSAMQAEGDGLGMLCANVSTLCRLCAVV